MSSHTTESKIKKEDYDRFFKKKDKKKVEKVEQIFQFQEQYFPNLIKDDESNNNNEENIISSNTVKSFAQMASLPKINEVVVEEIIKPGWMSIQYNRNSRKTIIRNGEKTKWRIEYEKKEKEMNSLDYRMNAAVENMKKNHRQYIEYYNEVYGEGAYEDKFMYDVETSSDEEDFSDNEEDCNNI